MGGVVLYKKHILDRKTFFCPNILVANNFWRQRFQHENPDTRSLFRPKTKFPDILQHKLLFSRVKKTGRKGNPAK